MKKILCILLCATFLFSSSILLIAQTHTPGINHREHRQQIRIRQGIRSGELTRPEARRLEAEQGIIRADEAIAKSDGKVTPNERRKLQRELNRSSRDIYRQKHDGQVRH